MCYIPVFEMVTKHRFLNWLVVLHYTYDIYGTTDGPYFVQPPGTVITQQVVVTTQPGFFATQPGMVVTQPGVVTAQPGVVVTQPGVVTAQPGVVTQQVTTVFE